MKIKLLSLSVSLMALATVISAFGGGYPGGSPAGYTGSPGDAKNCVNCHGGSASATTGMISTNIPATGYYPDSTYQVTVSVTGSGYKGFEVSPQNLTGTQLGTLIAGTNNHLTGGTKYVTQNARISSSPATWVFSWKAPAAGTGDVTFYAAYCISKSVTKLENITVIENTSAPLNVIAGAGSTTINLGDSTQLSATASGGTGSYSYQWTSNPPGFSSTQQNPWVKPLVSATYTVTVTDGQNSDSDAVNITVNNPQGIGVMAAFSLELSPNPCQGLLNLQTVTTEELNARIDIYDAGGDLVFRSQLEVMKGSGIRQLDIHELPSGVYLLKFQAGGISETRRIVKY